MIRDILRFNRRSQEVFDLDEPLSLGEYLSRRAFGREFVDHYLLPISAAIWSCPPGQMLDCPARFFVAFFKNHGLLQIRDRPRWKTIHGGAKTYVDRLMEPLFGRIRLNCPIQSILRRKDCVVVKPENASAESFDQVVCASHADQTLKMLTDRDETECEVLRALPYQRNDAVLHTDISVLPRRRQAWASWNYHVTLEDDSPVSVTYDLGRLQNCDSPEPILLTLNRPKSVDPSKVLGRFVFHHPLFSTDSIAAQKRQDELNGRRRTFFCGAYWGYGFHEDGVNSALAVANYFGIGLDACKAASTKDKSPIGVSAR